ncbi:Transcription termination factor like [Actinidia chinensis var. chinensis]|uniref:Transcription termination factor like n=1 Tax=Actinidia chinensis var. chinensis TaxID=1590841 RepID=A0A2R6QCN8_ACTCC|nr:Transcription termination factor like [Actinidia chinensis var. chinensis]
MQALYSPFSLSSKPTRAFLCFSSSAASLSSTAHISTNPILFNYLIETFSFPQPKALRISNRFSRIKTLQKPQSVVQFLKQLGFSETHIQSAVKVSPQILFSDIDRTLKPKLQFFQDLGLAGPDLGKFISKHSVVLSHSLDKRLIPCVNVMKKVIVNDKNNRDLIRVLQRGYWFFATPESRLLCNIALLENCGIVGSQLSMLLMRQSRLLTFRESMLRDLVSRVLDMGFSVHSRMFVYGLYTVSCLSGETFNRKLDLLHSFGFSKEECMEMFRRTPGLLRTSEEKLKFGIEFFLNDIKVTRSLLICQPHCLMNSMNERVIPRYRVLQVIKSKRLLMKDPRFLNVLHLSEGEFLEKYISRFTGDAEELLVAYKGHLLDPSGE